MTDNQNEAIQNPDNVPDQPVQNPILNQQQNLQVINQNPNQRGVLLLGTQEGYQPRIYVDQARIDRAQAESNMAGGFVGGPVPQLQAPQWDSQQVRLARIRIADFSGDKDPVAEEVRNRINARNKIYVIGREERVLEVMKFVTIPITPELYDLLPVSGIGVIPLHLFATGVTDEIIAQFNDALYRNEWHASMFGFSFFQQSARFFYQVVNSHLANLMSVFRRVMPRDDVIKEFPTLRHNAMRRLGEIMKRGTLFDAMYLYPIALWIMSATPVGYPVGLGVYPFVNAQQTQLYLQTLEQGLVAAMGSLDLPSRVYVLSKFVDRFALLNEVLNPKVGMLSDPNTTKILGDIQGTVKAFTSSMQPGNIRLTDCDDPLFWGEGEFIGGVGLLPYVFTKSLLNVINPTIGSGEIEAPNDTQSTPNPVRARAQDKISADQQALRRTRTNLNRQNALLNQAVDTVVGATTTPGPMMADTVQQSVDALRTTFQNATVFMANLATTLDGGTRMEIERQNEQTGERVEALISEVLAAKNMQSLNPVDTGSADRIKKIATELKQLLSSVINFTIGRIASLVEPVSYDGDMGESSEDFKKGLVDFFFAHVQNTVSSVRPYPFMLESANVTAAYLISCGQYVVAGLRIGMDDEHQAERVKLISAVNARTNPLITSCTRLEFIAWTDTFKNLYGKFFTQDATKATGALITELYTMAFSNSNPDTGMSDLLRLTSEYGVSTYIDEYIRLCHGQPLDQVKVKVKVALESMANNDRLLLYLRGKTLQIVAGERKFVTQRVNQAKLENAYEQIISNIDFDNEPKLLELKKQRTELYALKKQISTIKEFDSMSYMVEPDPIRTETDVYYANMENFHSCYFTFPKFEKSGRASTHVIQVDFAWKERGDLQNRDGFTTLYSFRNVDEDAGFQIKSKAYPYWTNYFGRILFKQKQQDISNVPYGGALSHASAVIADQYVGRHVGDFESPLNVSGSNSGQLVMRLRFIGYTKSFRLDTRVYMLKDNEQFKYDFLHGFCIGQKYLSLLNKITKLTYKIEKYRDKVTAKMKYGHINQSRKMLQTVYSAFGGERDKKFYKG